MSLGQKAVKFLNHNIVMITGVSIIIATHWGWSKLQQTSLVPKEARQELPIIIGAKYVEKKIIDEFDHITGKTSPERDESS